MFETEFAPVPTKWPVWKIKMRLRGCEKASGAAAKRDGAAEAPRHRLAMRRTSSGSVTPEPSAGTASASETTLTSRGT